MSKTKFSHFEGARGDKNQIFRTKDAEMMLRQCWDNAETALTQC